MALGSWRTLNSIKSWLGQNNASRSLHREGLPGSEGGGRCAECNELCPLGEPVRDEA